MADLDLEEELLQVAGRKRPRGAAHDLSDDGEAGSSECSPSFQYQTSDRPCLEHSQGRARALEAFQRLGTSCMLLLA